MSFEPESLSEPEEMITTSIVSSDLIRSNIFEINSKVLSLSDNTREIGNVAMVYHPLAASPTPLPVMLLFIGAYGLSDRRDIVAELLPDLLDKNVHFPINPKLISGEDKIVVVCVNQSKGDMQVMEASMAETKKTRQTLREEETKAKRIQMKKQEYEKLKTSYNQLKKALENEELSYKESIDKVNLDIGRKEEMEKEVERKFRLELAQKENYDRYLSQISERKIKMVEMFEKKLRFIEDKIRKQKI
jgi:hypothetical protein